MAADAGIMVAMPEPTIVWEVDLLRGRLDERRGILELEEDALVFRPDGAPVARRLAFVDVRRVRRTLGSPVIVVTHGEARLETAYYFVEPPPLRPPTETDLRPTLRSPKRRLRRQAFARLSEGGVLLRDVLRAWERELRGAVAAARRD